MDIISFNEASTANGRIESFIENPDSTSGVLTVPKTIAAGETITIPAGRVAILPDVQVDGNLVVDGDLFIPTGSMTSQVVQKVASTDNAIVRFDGTTGQVQNSAITIDDNGNIGSGTQSFNGFGGSGFKNYLYNPKFDVAQRGTVFANNVAPGGKVFTVDRWSTYFYDINNTRFVNTTAGEVSNNAIKFGRFDNKTDTFPSWLAQDLEIKDSVPLRGKTVTISFWAKKGSGLSGSFNVYLRTGTTGDENWAANYTGQAELLYQPSLTTTLTKYTFTTTIGTNIKQVGLIFGISSHSASATTNDWVWIEKVQLEEGSIATPFENRPYGLELSLCQRYYYSSGIVISQVVQQADGGGNFRTYDTHKVCMRATPTIIVKSTLGTVGKVTANYESGSYGGSSVDSSGTAGAIQISSNGFTIIGLHNTNTYWHGYTFTASAEL